MKYRATFLFVGSGPFSGLLCILSGADRELLAGDLDKPSASNLCLPKTLL